MFVVAWMRLLSRERRQGGGQGTATDGDFPRSDSFIKFRIMNGKEGLMPAFGGTLTDADQLADLIAYIRSLKD